MLQFARGSVASSLVRRMRREWPLHLMILPSIVLVIIFAYTPMYGLIIAFQKFVPAKGLFGDQRWAGLANFRYVMDMPNFLGVMWNTMSISVMKLTFGFLFTLVVALLLNEIKNRRYKRIIQTVVYFPHFISWVIFSGILLDILSPSSGLINQTVKALGMKPLYFLGDNSLFKGTIVVTDIWKEFGFNTVIYMAAMTSVDPILYEAAVMDGANRWRQTWHVTLPGISMVVILMMVLNMGNVLNAGFEQIFNLLSVQVYESGDIIDTLVYRMGLVQMQYGPATAVGLFKSVVSCGLISISYWIAYRFFSYKLF